MVINNKLKILKAVKIILLIIYIPILLFYLGIIVPEYLACDKLMPEGKRGVNIWGSEVLCDCESQAFGEVFFQLFSLIICGLSIIMAVIFYSIYSLKRSK